MCFPTAALPRFSWRIVRHFQAVEEMRYTISPLSLSLNLMHNLCCRSRVFSGFVFHTDAQHTAPVQPSQTSGARCWMNSGFTGDSYSHWKQHHSLGQYFLWPTTVSFSYSCRVPASISQHFNQRTAAGSWNEFECCQFLFVLEKSDNFQSFITFFICKTNVTSKSCAHTGRS